MIYSSDIMYVNKPDFIVKYMPHIKHLIYYIYKCDNCMDKGYFNKYNNIIQKFLDNNNVKIPNNIINVDYNDIIKNSESYVKYIINDNKKYIDNNIPILIFTDIKEFCTTKCNNSTIIVNDIFDPSKIPYPMFNFE